MVTLIGVVTLTYSLGVELLNFGALVAFMGVNASAFVHYFLRGARKSLGNFLPPLLGFIVCFYLWYSLGPKAKFAGLCWLAAGVLYGAWRTAFFTKPLQFAKIENDDRTLNS